MDYRPLLFLAMCALGGIAIGIGLIKIVEPANAIDHPTLIMEGLFELVAPQCNALTSANCS
jgi:hypothetical protein